MDNFHLQVLATGGTLAKRYDARSGQLAIDNDVVGELLAGLTLPDMALQVHHVLARDSLDMTAAERDHIAVAVKEHAAAADAIVVTHGTDTLADTAAVVAAAMVEVSVPVVLTGAMVPHCCAHSDARQNVAQAVAACRLLSPGVYVAFHGRVLAASQAVKDYDRLTFVAATD